MSDTVRGNWCNVMSVDPPLVIVINIACQVVLDGWLMGGLHQIECIYYLYNLKGFLSNISKNSGALVP